MYGVKPLLDSPRPHSFEASDRAYFLLSLDDNSTSQLDFTTLRRICSRYILFQQNIDRGIAKIEWIISPEWAHAWPPPRDPLRSEPRAASRVGAPSTGTQRRRHIKYDYQFYESLNLFFWRVRRPSRVQLRMQKWYARPMVHNIARESIAFLFVCTYFTIENGIG